ncbi:MAG: BREX system P-loop protein BrxC [Cyanobacteria bacterium CAN_BIN43]|nr:BREX system P-loop protein BrxC [Cyanobacteria bacterium CAN_BIN43]
MSLVPTIDQLFQKSIHRNINGVIKVAQQDNASVYQELDEYIVTKELDKHFHAFFERYTSALDTPTDKMGVWISGFFGSGKSHFLKILSYLLANQEVKDQQAVDFFDEIRIPDPMLRANMTRSAHTPADVILFNIDSKADATSKNQKDSIVKVFQKVFDEHLGYFGTVPAIAEFERELDKQGCYPSFQQAFEEASGTSWDAARDAWGFHQDEISHALQVSRGMSVEAANRLVDTYDQNYSLSVEKFACTVREYLDRQGLQHRLIFMVDEVGQYIGENSDLMLNLQTVVEDLGIHCSGRAWVVVTSQEAMDEITKGKIKGNDFSKIVGRFYRPLSLSSANTDEVIRMRLLAKTEAAKAVLKPLYSEKFALLKNQISFTQDSAEMPGYRSEGEFVAAYPFVPYQFGLLQKVFTEIRLMGAAGKHLASGERSLLDAFQVAAKAVAEQPSGVLVPFQTFYLAIEGFLDSAVSQVINQAGENAQLQPFDIDLLKTLFMVKYVKEIRANLDNLTTLCLSHIDQDKLMLREQVQEGLVRLERQTLIQRVGDEYSFLTHEEQDVGRAIKNIEIDPGKVTSEFQGMVWESIFTEKKLKYDSRHQYSFNRKLDDQAYGQQVNDFALHIVTPYADRYRDLQSNEACLLGTASGQEVWVRLPDDGSLIDDVNERVRTANYLARTDKSGLTPSLQNVLTIRGEQNSQRRTNIENRLRNLIAQADVFACGSKVEISTRDAKTVLSEGLIYLIGNVYTKLNYVDRGFATEDDVINALTRETEEQNLQGNHANLAAHDEMQNWLANEARSHRRVSIRVLLEKFMARPCGWSELDTLGVMAELVNKGKAELRRAQETVNTRERGLVVKVRSRVGQDEYLVRLCQEVDQISLRVARELAQDLLPSAPPTDHGKLYEAYQQALTKGGDDLKGWLTQAQREQLPFEALLNRHLELLRKLKETDGIALFFEAVRSQREDLKDYTDDVQKLRSFFTAQLPVFLKAKTDLAKLEPELRHISDERLLKQVEMARSILGLDDPTAQIPRLSGLLKPVQDQVQAILQQQVAEVQQTSRRVREQVGNYARSAHDAVFDRLDLATLTQEIEQVTCSAKGSISIDSAIARQSELENLGSALISKVDRRATEILEQLERQRQIDVPGDPATEVKPMVVKPIVPVKVARAALKPVLETAEDVEEYLMALRGILMRQIEQENRVRLE